MRFITPSLLILSTFIMGGVIFKSMAPTRCGTIIENDTIFVLTGDARRIPFALRQMNRAQNIKMYIIGAGGQITRNLPPNVIIESTSKNTHQNALAIKKIADDNNLYRIVLITTVDHFNRAHYLIGRHLPDIEIVPCPVPLSGMSADKRLERWATEYIKYIGTLLGFRES